jgi:acetyl esterase/lipase
MRNKSILYFLMLTLSIAFLPSAPYTQAKPLPLRYLQPVFEKVSTDKNLIYREVEDRKGAMLQLKMDIYQPIGDSLEKRPLLVLIHGGGFRGGSKEAMKLRCEAFARFGYVTVSINYRLSANHVKVFEDAIKDAVSDARHAIDYLRSHAESYRLDTQQIFIGGSSAGGITAIHMGVEDSNWDKTGIKGIINLWGAFFGKDEEVDSSDPAVCIIHGELDPTVPIEHSIRLNKLLIENNVVVWFYPVKNVKHGVPSKGPYPFHYEEALFMYSLMD